MNKDMAHAHYLFPLNLWMFVLELYRQHVGGFTNDFYTFHNSILEKLVILKIIKSLPAHKFFNIIKLF